MKNDFKIDWVPLMNLHPKILFGNFVAENYNGKIYAEYLNISKEPVEISIPEVELQLCKTIKTGHPVRAGEDGSRVNESSNTVHKISCIRGGNLLENHSDQEKNIRTSPYDSVTNDMCAKNQNTIEKNTNPFDENTGNVNTVDEANYCYPASLCEPGAQHTASNSNLSRISQPFENPIDVTEDPRQSNSSPSRSNQSIKIPDETQLFENQRNVQPETAYLVAGSRPPREKSPWKLREEEAPLQNAQWEK